MTRSLSYSSALVLLFTLVLGAGCGQELQGHMYLSDSETGKATHAIVVSESALGGTRWSLVGDASGDFSVEVAKGTVENGTLVGLPDLDPISDYWWAPMGLTMGDDGSVTFAPDTAVSVMPEARRPFPSQ